LGLGFGLGLGLGLGCWASEKVLQALAQNMQVGPCIPVGTQHRYNRLELAQLLGRHGVFLTCGSGAGSIAGAAANAR
jgi:hypothetical protein